MQTEYPPSYVPFIRLYNSYILNPVSSFESVASSLFGVQSQVFNASAIAFALRTEGKTFSQFKNALDTLHLVRLWGIRTTIHIYHRDDWNTLLSYLSTADNWYKAKMSTNGIDIDDIVAKILDIIEDVEYFDRRLLVDKGINREHLGSWGDLLIELNNRGHIFHHIDFANKNRLFGNTQVVLGTNILESTMKLLDIKKELALRFFRAYAPATIRDFAHWLGITVRESEEYFQLIKDELFSVKCRNKEYYIESISRSVFDQVFREYANDVSYYLLPKFDPLLLAYRDKTWIVEKHLHNRIWKVAGHVEGVVLQRGKVIATWRYQLTNKAVNFEISPFHRRFSIKRMEKSCCRIAQFFERSIGDITLKEEFLL